MRDNQPDRIGVAPLEAASRSVGMVVERASRLLHA
jgi:hypothetical protein